MNNMKKLDKYGLIGEIALESRLSLNNLCKLINKEATEDNKKDLYNKVIENFKSDDDKIEIYQYLFFNETVSQSQIESSESYRRALILFSKYSFFYR